MKKFLYSMAAMLMMTAALATFTACGDDNDEPEVQEKEKTVKEAQLSVTLCVNQNIADAYDVSGKSFLGDDIRLSTTTTEVNFKGNKVPMYTMTLDGTSNAVPLIAIMNVTFTLKEGYQVPEKSDFALAALAAGTIEYTDGTNSTLSAKSYELENNGVYGNKIEEYTANLNKNFGRLKATLNRDGIDFTTSSEE